MTDRNDLDSKTVRDALDRERSEIEAISANETDDRRPVELDQQSVGRLSRMDAMQVQAMAQATEARRRVRLQRIAAALKRLEQGEFGYCVQCGDEIALKRLELDPTTPRCIDCAE